VGITGDLAVFLSAQYHVERGQGLNIGWDKKYVKNIGRKREQRACGDMAHQFCVYPHSIYWKSTQNADGQLKSYLGEED
jgi:hypothetical protein